MADFMRYPCHHPGVAVQYQALWEKDQVGAGHAQTTKALRNDDQVQSWKGMSSKEIISSLTETQTKFSKLHLFFASYLQSCCHINWPRLRDHVQKLWWSTNPKWQDRAEIRSFQVTRIRFMTTLDGFVALSRSLWTLTTRGGIVNTVNRFPFANGHGKGGHGKDHLCEKVPGVGFNFLPNSVTCRWTLSLASIISALLKPVQKTLKPRAALMMACQVAMAIGGSWQGNKDLEQSLLHPPSLKPGGTVPVINCSRRSEAGYRSGLIVSKNDGRSGLLRLKGKMHCPGESKCILDSGLWYFDTPFFYLKDEILSLFFKPLLHLSQVSFLFKWQQDLFHGINIVINHFWNAKDVHFKRVQNAFKIRVCTWLRGWLRSQVFSEYFPIAILWNRNY